MERLTDNEVAEVAKMQAKIDHYEEFLSNLHLNIISPSEHLTLVHGDIETYDIWSFIEFIKNTHPEVIAEFKDREQQELSKLIRQQKQRAKSPIPFWKRKQHN